MGRNKRLISYLALFIVLGIVVSQVRVCSAANGRQAVMMRIQKTVQIIEGQDREWGKRGIEIFSRMQKVKANFKGGNLDRVEELLDEVNGIIGVDTGGGSGEAAGYSGSGGYEKINVIGAAVKNGPGDPSLEYGPDGTGWLTYTCVDVKNSELTTFLAKSTDKGRTWKFVKVINEPTPVTLNGEKGNWVHETTTIVYDPDDAGKEWKIFWFKYFRDIRSLGSKKKDTWVDSWIAYKYASDPEDEWSEEIPVFGMGNFRNKGIDLAGLHPDLKDMVFFFELGSLYKDGTLYLSVEGSASPTGMGQWDTKKIVLLASNDHGKTWEYVGILLDNKDAKRAGYLIFTASSLVEEKGRIFLLASPSGKLSDLKDPEGHHDGTDVFEFEDISRGRLKRDSNGKLVVIKHIDDNLIKGGQGDYDEQNTYGGIVIPQQDAKYYPEVFQLFSTKQKIVD